MTNLTKLHAEIIASSMIESCLGMGIMLSYRVRDRYAKALEYAFDDAWEQDWNTMLEDSENTKEKQKLEKTLNSLHTKFVRMKDVEKRHEVFVTWIHMQADYLNCEVKDYEDNLQLRFRAAKLENYAK